MINMKQNSKIIIIFIVLLLTFSVLFLKDNVNTSIYLDGENVSCSSKYIPFFHDNAKMEKEIVDYSLNLMENPNSNITTLKNGIYCICKEYGYKNINIDISSQFGKNTMPIIFKIDGTSMDPTLKDGQYVIVEKTKNIHVGDIVVANNTNYGIIVKRVGIVKGNDIFLESDNKTVEIYQENGFIYEKKGVSTWTNLSDIYGIVKIY